MTELPPMSKKVEGQLRRVLDTARELRESLEHPEVCEAMGIDDVPEWLEEMIEVFERTLKNAGKAT